MGLSIALKGYYQTGSPGSGSGSALPAGGCCCQCSGWWSLWRDQVTYVTHTSSPRRREEAGNQEHLSITPTLPQAGLHSPPPPPPLLPVSLPPSSPSPPPAGPEEGVRRHGGQSGLSLDQLRPWFWGGDGSWNKGRFAGGIFMPGPPHSHLNTSNSTSIFLSSTSQM